MFGGSVPNFQGFEYYVGGVFVLPGAKDDLDSREITIRKPLSCQNLNMRVNSAGRTGTEKTGLLRLKTREVVAVAGHLEQLLQLRLLVNLYYNRHLDYDLSEQNIISCTCGICSMGDSMIRLLIISEDIGIVMEDCFPYTASDQDCSEMCSNPQERIKIDNWTILFI